MSKAIIQDPTVVNYITKTLTNTENDCFVGNSEWNNGTHSDVVLEPKPSDLGLSPIIVEIQQKVDKAFMKRIVMVASRTVANRISGGYDFPCEPWVADCIIFSKESLDKDNVDNPLILMFALGLFFTSRALSILNAPLSDDPTMQYLYNLALSRKENCSNNIVLSLLESQHREYEKLLTLANTATSSDVFVQAIIDAKTQNDKLKRKYGSDPTGSSSNKRATKTNASSSINDDNDIYEKGMDFVEKFKQARIQKGHAKMDWITCLEEGKRLGLLKYKNPDALRN